MNSSVNKINNVLQQGADQLAIKHQQRLHQMTRDAVYGKAVSQLSRPKWMVRTAVSAFSIGAIALVVQLQPTTNIALKTDVAAMSEAAPEWVNDTEVPVAVLENIAFYEWLEKEMKENKDA